MSSRHQSETPWAAAAAGLALAAGLPALAGGDMVRIQQGALQGERLGDVVAFKAIPLRRPAGGRSALAPAAGPGALGRGAQGRRLGPACIQPVAPNRPPLATSD